MSIKGLSSANFLRNVFSWLKHDQVPSEESFQLSPRGRLSCFCPHHLLYFLQIWGHLRQEHTSSSAVTEGLRSQLWVVYVLQTKEMEMDIIFSMRTNKHFFMVFLTHPPNCKPLEDKNHVTNAILCHKDVPNKSTHYLMISHLQLGISWSKL